MTDQEPEQRPFARAFLVALQMLAMGLCVGIVSNMLLEPLAAPVPQCPIKATE